MTTTPSTGLERSDALEPRVLDPLEVLTYALDEAARTAESFVDALVAVTEVTIASECTRCGEPIEWDPDERDWRSDSHDTVCPVGLDRAGFQVGSIDHEPPAGVAAPIPDPVVLVLDRAHAQALRGAAGRERRRREKRLARSTFVPGPGRKHMDAVIAGLWADIEIALVAIGSGQVDQAAVAFRPGGVGTAGHGADHEDDD